ncbi:hypothetical protein DMENIID0001_059380 [Sergentomyia squamirostris]
MDDSEEVAELIMGVLRELKDIKEMLTDNTKRLHDLQTTVEAFTNSGDLDSKSFPAHSLEELDELEEMMKDSDSREYLTTQLRMLLKPNDESWIGQIMDEELLLHFNMSGINGKRSLRHLELVQFGIKFLGIKPKNLTSYLRKVKDKHIKRQNRIEPDDNTNMADSEDDEEKLG